MATCLLSAGRIERIQAACLRLVCGVLPWDVAIRAKSLMVPALPESATHRYSFEKLNGLKRIVLRADNRTTSPKAMAYAVANLIEPA